MNQNTVHFTKKTLDKLTSRDKKEVYYTDDKQKALMLRVSKTGVKTFYFYKWNASKGYPEKKPIGKFPDISVDEARDMVQAGVVEFNQLKSSPEVKAKRSKSAATRSFIVDDLWKKYRDEVGGAIKSFRYYDGPYRQHFEIWYHRDITTIERDEVQLWVNMISATVGKPTARTCHAVFRQFINWFIETRAVNIGNPCKFVKVPHVPSRVRFLKPGDEYNRYIEALDAYKDQNICDIFRLCLLTGARVNNVCAMKWDDLELEGAGNWHIPASKSKNGVGYSIRLTDDAFELLKRRRKVIDSDYVFPSAGKGKRPYITKTWIAFQRILKVAKITNFRIHDLRHTLASYMAMAGATVPKIAKQLGHKSLRSAEVYAHLINESAQFAAEDAIEAMRNPSLILLRRSARAVSA